MNMHLNELIQVNVILQLSSMKGNRTLTTTTQKPSMGSLPNTAPLPTPLRLTLYLDFGGNHLLTSLCIFITHTV